MRILQVKKWYWIGFGCWTGVVYGPYRTKKKANDNKPMAGMEQFRLSKRYPGD